MDYQKTKCDSWISNNHHSPITNYGFTSHPVTSRSDTSRVRRTHVTGALRPCHGFTYIGLLIFIALMGAALAGTGIVFRAQAQREKEKELLFVGDQFRRAIGQYYERTPGGGKRFPQSLEDLLLDSRYPVTQRYLRRVYRDPMTGSQEWGLVRAPDERIVGVFSKSERAPMKVEKFSAKDAEFAGKQSYVEWKFVYVKAAEPEAGNAKPVASAQQLQPGSAAEQPDFAVVRPTPAAAQPNPAAEKSD